MYIVDNKAKCHNRFIRCARVKNSDLFKNLGFSRPLGDSLQESNFSRNPLEIGETGIRSFNQHLYDEYSRFMEKQNIEDTSVNDQGETDD